MKDIKDILLERRIRKLEIDGKQVPDKYIGVFNGYLEEIAEGLADYTKQVRKEVVQEFSKWCDKNFNWVGDGTGYDGQDYNEMIGSNNTINKLRELLDQIQ